MDKKKNSAVHFIGIGGIGVSALAKYYLSLGIAVTGSDIAKTEVTGDLQRSGAKVIIGKHHKKNIPDGKVRIIHTAAIPPKNPELLGARARHLGPETYAQAVGELTRQHPTITISGSHGKSTTTALVALALIEGYFDPTVIVGTKLKEFGNSNFRKGHGSHLVLEADEWNKSFLNYSPTHAIVTNIDAEHLDTYKTSKEVEKAFEKYLSRVPENGIIVANADDERTRRVAGKFGKKVRWYSKNQREAALLRRILKIPGEHNVSNALAALTLGRALGISEPALLHALSNFTGTWRRFEFKGLIKGAHIFDDYGHHPSEIKATLTAARSRFPMRRVWCVYQPHQYQRLQYLWDDFVGAFDMADRVCLLPVYGVAGRDTVASNKKTGSSALVRELLLRGKNAHHVQSFSAAKKFIWANSRAGDVILMMGAGDIYLLTKKLLNS